MDDLNRPLLSVMIYCMRGALIALSYRYKKERKATHAGLPHSSTSVILTFGELPHNWISLPSTNHLSRKNIIPVQDSNAN